MRLIISTSLLDISFPQWRLKLSLGGIEAALPPAARQYTYVHMYLAVKRRQEVSE
jgi:hypothetical protein